MRALVLLGPGRAEVDDVDDPVAGGGGALIDIELAGICGTDIELFRGDMAYFADGHAHYPLRPGHEWCGRVRAVGAGVDSTWVGRRVSGDTMLGCGSCERCLRGKHHVCEFRYEVGVRGGWPGALAEQLVVPVSSLCALPDSITAEAGAMVEPGGNALRAVNACNIRPRDRILIWGAATVGLLCALFARAQGAQVLVLGRREASVAFARLLGLEAFVESELPAMPFDAIIDATNAPSVPERALRLVEPSGRLAYIGLAGTPSTIDTRELVLKDVTAVGILGASSAITETIASYAARTVDPTPLIGRTVGLEEVLSVLAGDRGPGTFVGPKTLVDPRR